MDCPKKRLLLWIAEDILSKEKGAFERLKYEVDFCNGAYHPFVAKLYLDDLEDEFSKKHGHLYDVDVPPMVFASRAAKNKETATRLINEWYKKHYPQFIFYVEPLPPLEKFKVVAQKTKKQRKKPTLKKG